MYGYGVCILCKCILELENPEDFDIVDELFGANRAVRYYRAKVGTTENNPSKY